ncbi:MAG: helix-turn-helix domain-containing protein [Acidobacteriaceae bacterium]|nr:helix-turn-helix domain-containing protein [Acidobacteriaceae bacterium]
MRPLFHPEIAEVPLEAILHALSDPARVTLFVDIVGRECSQNCSTLQAVLEKPIAKSTLSQHFKVLREAGLIRSERRGVEMLNTARCAEVEARYPGLLAAIVKAHSIQRQAEAEKTSRPAGS